MTAIGAIVKWTAGNMSLPSSLTPLTWDAVDHMNGSFVFWTSGSPTKIVVPAGVNRLRFYWGGFLETAINRTFTNFNLYKSSAALDIVKSSLVNTSYTGIAASSPILSVADGDEFVINANTTSGGNFYPYPDSFFSCVTPESVIGAVTAQMASDTDATWSPGPVLSWATPSIDTHSTHDGTTGFVVPTGVNYCIPSLVTRSSDFDSSSDMSLRVYANGVEFGAMKMGDASWWARGWSLGPRAVTPGETITFRYLWGAGGQTIQSAHTRMSIEWLG